jgi:hypothetical protein
MHELPKDLGKGLRSFRNSVHRHSGQHDLDLEKLERLDTPENAFGGENPRQIHETSSSRSLILVRAYHVVPWNAVLMENISDSILSSPAKLWV